MVVPVLKSLWEQQGFIRSSQGLLSVIEGKFFKIDSYSGQDITGIRELPLTFCSLKRRV